MIQNYLKLAFRNLRKNKMYALVNIGGLALGMSVAMLIGLWIRDELGYNTYNKNYDSIASIQKNRTYNGNVFTEASQSIPLAEELRTSYGEYFDQVVVSSYPGQHSIRYGDNCELKRGLYMQEGGAEILDFKIIKGALNQIADPYSILITERLAKHLFKDEDPINKIVRIDNKIDVKIAGVFKNFPFNSSFRAISFYGSMKIFETTDPWVKNSIDDWDENSLPVYVKLKPGMDGDAVSAKIKNVVAQHSKDDTNPEIFLHPMKKWRMYPDFKNGKNIASGLRYVWLFGWIGFFVLALACINFMNLNTAQSGKRAKEIGIRKSIGSKRGQLIAQFYSEAILVSLLGAFFAIPLLFIALPVFNEATGKRMEVVINSPGFYGIIICFGLLMGLFSGSYPALYLSGFKPHDVLKKKFQAGRFSGLSRKSLVVLQFVVSSALLIATAIVCQQIQFAGNRPAGYDREGLIYIQKRSPDINRHFDALQKDLLDAGGVVELSQSSGPTTESWFSSSDFNWKGKDPNFKEDFVTLRVTPEFGKTTHWNILQGRDFSRDFSTDTSAVIINESALKLMGFVNPIDEIITWENKNYKVIGVIKNLLMDSPYESIKPTVITMRNANMTFVNMRLNPGLGAQEAIARIEPVFKKYNPSEPFDYHFVSDDYNEKFETEARVAKLISFFAIVSILISCLGIFGLASFIAEQRTKEIGIRKVLGASVFGVWSMLSKEFVVLVFAALILATPLCYYLMDNWLQSYEYRMSISWWVFLASGVALLLVTLMTVSFQTIKAAITNPVKSLRSE